MAAIPYTLLLRIEATGVPTFGLLLSGFQSGLRASGFNGQGVSEFRFFGLLGLITVA